MTPAEVDELLAAYGRRWRWHVFDAEAAEWRKALARHPALPVWRVLDDLRDEGVERPSLVDVTRRLSPIANPRPPYLQPAPDPPAWDGNTPRGRELIAAARAQLDAAPEYVGPRRERS